MAERLALLVLVVGILFTFGSQAQYAEELQVLELEEADKEVVHVRNFETYYPRYEYKPYTGDCSRREYDVYTEFVYSFREDWYNTERYRAYEMNEEERQYWKEYGDEYSIEYYPQPSDYPQPPITPPKRGTCCWQFDHELVERREHEHKGRERIEYRQLTQVQRTSLHDAMNEMKDTGVWDTFAHQHRYSNAPHAHNGAAFLPWHREYLFRLENALFAHGYSGPGLPYVDTTLDQGLPNPADSILWTDDYLGNLFGPVTTGFAADWTVIDDCSYLGANLRRNGIGGSQGQCFLFSDFDLEYVFSKKCFKEITCNTDCKFEGDHAAVHNFVGGHMGSSTCAPSDPFFFLHHAFVDCVWETFRQNHQATDIEKEYPSWINNMDGIGTPSLGYEWFSTMQPFSGLVNAHGIQNFYRDYYECQPRPKACQTDSDCHSPALWCRDNSRCVSKVKEGGDCRGLTHNACMCPSGKSSQCLRSTCSCVNPPVINPPVIHPRGIPVRQ